MRRAVVVLTLLLFSGAAQAQKFNERFGDGRLGLGADVIHEKGMPAAIVTLTPVSVLVWSHNAGVALAYPFGRFANGLHGSFGGILVKNLDQLTGTHLNFFGTVGYCRTRVCLSFAHVSHGRGAFNIREDAPNRGLNLLFLEYRYR